MDKRLYTLNIYLENHVGLLSQVSTIFTRRKINIESFSASASAVKGIHKFTIVVECNLEDIKNVVKQLNKRVEVLKAFFYTDNEIISQEVALYKVATAGLLADGVMGDIIYRYSARILEVNDSYTIIEKSGRRERIQQLFDELSKYNVLQFVSSGRVSITKSRVEEVSLFLEEQEKRRLEEEAAAGEDK